MHAGFIAAVPVLGRTPLRKPVAAVLTLVVSGTALRRVPAIVRARSEYREEKISNLPKHKWLPIRALDLRRRQPWAPARSQVGHSYSLLRHGPPVHVSNTDEATGLLSVRTQPTPWSEPNALDRGYGFSIAYLEPAMTDPQRPLPVHVKQDYVGVVVGGTPRTLCWTAVIRLLERLRTIRAPKIRTWWAPGFGAPDRWLAAPGAS